MMEVLKCANLQLHQSLASQFIPKPMQDELDDLYRPLDRRPVLLPILPVTVTNLHQNVKLESSHLPYHLYLMKSFWNRKKCEESFFSTTVTQQQAKYLEKVTSSQADPKTWLQYRAALSSSDQQLRGEVAQSVGL